MAPAMSIPIWTSWRYIRAEVSAVEVRAIFVDFFIVEGTDGFLTDFSESLFLLSEPNRKKTFVYLYCC